MREVLFRLGNTAAVVRGVGGDYVVSVGNCSCWAGLTGKMCVHRRLVGMPVELKKAIDSLKRYKSTLKGLNDVFGGSLYNSDEVVCLYGKPQVGKTLFSLQEAIGCGVNTLYIDTEGGFKGMASKWSDIFFNRFKTKSDVYVESRRTLESLSEFMGFDVRVIFKQAGDEDDDSDTDEKPKNVQKSKSVEDVVKSMQKKEMREKKEKGKMELRILQRFNFAEVDGWITEKGIEMVILDSVSAPIRAAIPDDRQNFPARATATSLIMGKLVELQEKYNIGVLVTSHASFDPTNPYEGFASLRGGIVIHHYAKRILYMDMREKKDMRDYRRFWVMRIEDSPKFSSVVGAKIDDAGFHDEPSLDKVLTDREKSLLG